MANIAILSFYSGITERGVETYAQEMAKRLCPKNKVTIFQAGAEKISKFKIVQIKTPLSIHKTANSILNKVYLDKNSFKILLFTIKVAPKILKGKYDIIFVLNGGWQTLLTRIVSKLSGAKIIIPGEAGIGSDDAINLLFRPDAFVALTKAQAKWAKKLTSEVKIVTIPNGVDLASFNPKVEAKEVPLEKPIVVCTSALDAYKRVDLTIKAVAKAKNLSLLVLGDGLMRGVIDSLGKRLLGKRYLRLVVPHDQIAGYYRACTVFTLASKTEAFGTSYIEAMACNIPVVTTGDDSRAEIIGEAGILTDPQNIDQYAKDLMMAANTSYKNKPYVQSLKFSWNKVAEKYSHLIHEISSN